MTCAFCEYEFCWACGASATSADDHFGPFKGCGVAMMDANVKPGDRGRRCSILKVLAVICRILFLIIIYPFWLVFAMPIGIGVVLYRMGKQADLACPCNFILFWFGFFFIGMPINICWIPIAVIFTLIVIVVSIIKCCQGCFMLCKPRDPNIKTASE